MHALELVDLLWPEHPPAAAESALSALLSKLRRTLNVGAAPVLTGRAELRLTLEEPIAVDAELAEAAVERAAAALGAQEWAAAAAYAQEALGAERGLPARLEGPWIDERRRELDDLRVRAARGDRRGWALRLGGSETRRRAEQAARCRDRAAAVPRVRPRRADGGADGARQPAEAMRAFDDVRVMLRDELGTNPGPALMAIHERLLRGESAPAARRGPPVAVVPEPARPARRRHDRPRSGARRPPRAAARGAAPCP